MDSKKKYIRWLIAGIVTVGMFVYGGFSYKKNHPDKTQGLYQVHKYTVATSEGAAASDNTIFVTVPDNNILFDPDCYTSDSCKLDSSNRINLSNGCVVGTVDKALNGFISNYTIYQKINDKDYSWTFEAKWERVKD